MRTRWIAVGVIVLLWGVWMVARPVHAVRAGEDGQSPVVEVDHDTMADYGENTEEVALKRWKTNQARHWRNLVVKR